MIGESEAADESGSYKTKIPARGPEFFCLAILVGGASSNNSRGRPTKDYGDL
ncbi:MAG: hypothetical protein Q4A71_02905 [Actinomycetaceae bacterium]|nr:hypothetical protein [Actinomycetaceae bacterium]